MQRLSGRECQQAVCQAGGACYSLAAHAQHAVQAVAAALVQAPLDQFEAATNAGEQIVEVMGDAAGQLADGFHLAYLVTGEFAVLLFFVWRLKLGVQALLQAMELVTYQAQSAMPGCPRGD